jgi:putative ABC transport system substrate-binding protein
MAQALERGFRELGYVPGRTIHIDYRSAEARLKPDVIVAGGGAPSARAAMKATSTIPIVFPASGDPIGEGLVKSLARPGGNVTGLSILSIELSAKRLQLLRELLPRLQTVAVLQDSAMRTTLDQISATEQAAAKLAIRVHVLSVASPEDYEAAFDAAKKAGAEALIVLPSSAFNANRRHLTRILIVAPPGMSTGYSKGPTRPRCRWSARPRSTWSSTCRRRRRWASQLRRRCSLAPTRSFNKRLA